MLSGQPNRPSRSRSLFGGPLNNSPATHRQCVFRFSLSQRLRQPLRTAERCHLHYDLLVSHALVGPVRSGVCRTGATIGALSGTRSASPCAPGLYPTLRHCPTEDASSHSDGLARSHPLRHTKRFCCLFIIFNCRRRCVRHAQRR